MRPIVSCALAEQWMRHPGTQCHWQLAVLRLPARVQDHEKAVLYFRRALRLNAGYISAWTLMGHEYIELRNTAAAVECYRRAVQLNPLDYRAWYGLGNAYELLDLPLWALYYFKRSLALRPYDPRMWCALGSVYERVGNGTGEAITCYERALQYKDAEGEATAITQHTRHCHSCSRDAGASTPSCLAPCTAALLHMQAWLCSASPSCTSPLATCHWQ